MFKLSPLRIAVMVVMGLLFVGPLLNVLAHPLTAISPGLGTVTSFAVLGGSTVTNTGPSVINGDLGVWPGLSVTGFFPPGIVVPPGTIHAGDAVAQQAQSDLTAAYNALANQACNFDLTGQDLGGLTLTPAVYCFSTSAQLTGELTLNALGDPNAVWVFQIGSTLTTAPGSSVVFTNGGSGPGCNLFWQVGSSATLDTTTAFKGNVLALASITMNTSANLDGRALARNGAVTLDTNVITPVVCFAAPHTSTALPATQTAIAATLTDVAPTLTAIALTPSPTLAPATRTAIAATETAIAATHTAIAPTLTAEAATLAPVLTAEAATQTAIAPALTAQAATRAAGTPGAEKEIRPRTLPSTGFEPGVHSVLSEQPADKAYGSYGDLWLEIPRLAVKMAIVGVPPTQSGWDVTWLSNQVGWLQGTAFPTWAGNSVLTGHVYDANGQAGPFVNLSSLQYGDRIIVHAWGQQYIYEVRSTGTVSPNSVSSVIKHETLPWVTLMTCKEYDAKSQSYKYRTIVKAVQVAIQ